MKLARKFILLLGLVLTVGLIGASISRVRSVIALYDQQLLGDQRVLAQVLRDAVVDIWTLNGWEEALALVAEVERRQGASTRIRWVWLGGSAEAYRPEDSEAAARAAVGLEPVVVDLRPEGQERILVYQRVMLNGLPAGGLEISRSTAFEGEIRDTIIRQEALISILVLLVYALAASSLGRRVVGAPIQRLIDQARRVGRGDFARSPALLQHDEIGELTDEMNTMATQLEETQRRMREERAARQEVEIQLRHADRLAKAGRLAAGIVHDTGTPLNVIAGRAKMIERATSPEEVSRAVEAIVVQSKRIAEMLRRLLDFSRPAEGDQEPVDLKALAEETRLLLEPMAKKHQVELELHAEGAPAVLARGGELRQVVTNLLVNAIQAMPRGGVVSISARAVASLESSGAARCLLSVRDRGDGIPPEILPRIFEPFFTTKSDRGGTGLGLSVCQAIVRDHGGELSVWSEQGQGAEFTISLPALVEEAEPCRVAS